MYLTFRLIFTSESTEFNFLIGTASRLVSCKKYFDLTSLHYLADFASLQLLNYAIGTKSLQLENSDGPKSQALIVSPLCPQHSLAQNQLKRYFYIRLPRARKKKYKNWSSIRLRRHWRWLEHWKRELKLFSIFCRLNFISRLATLIFVSHSRAFQWYWCNLLVCSFFSSFCCLSIGEA